MNQLGLRIREDDSVVDGDTQSQGEVVSLDRLFAMVRRQRWVIATSTAVGLFLGVAYMATTPKSYYASSRVLIDDRLNRLVEEVAATNSIFRDDTSISNQVEVLRSQPMAEAVVEKLQLHTIDTYMEPPVALAASLVASLKGTIGGVLDKVEGAIASLFEEPVEVVPIPEPTPEEAEVALKSQVARGLQDTVNISRVGRSHVIEIGFASHEPWLAADLSNAYAEAYIADQLNASFDARQRTSEWLQNRLSELYASSQAAALEVEEFRAEKGLSVTAGQLITEQRLEQLNNQLALAEGEAARAKALVDQYQAIVEAGADGLVDFATMSPNLTNDARVSELQERFVTVSTRLASVVTDYGPDHPQAVLLRNEQEELSEVIFGAFNRLLQQVRGEYEIAREREDALRASVGAATETNTLATQSQVQLRELEQRAETLSVLYENFLTRFEEIDQQSSFTVSNVRVLNFAEVPKKNFAPSTTRVLAVALVLGALFGAFLAVLREYRERFFRTGEQVASVTGLRFLGYLPLDESAKVSTATRLLNVVRGRAARQKQDRISRARPLFVSIQEPQSVFAETLRNVRIACDVTLEGQACKIIGVTSVLPGEGKSTISSNLANLMSLSGHNTLLIDGDLRNPGLSEALNIRTGAGVIEVATGEVPWRDAVRNIGATKLNLIPCIPRRQLSHTSELLQSKAVAEFLEQAKEAYQYIIVDLPPVGVVVDTKAVLPRLNKVVFVTEWGRTPRALVRQVLAREAAVKSKTVGVVLNKVDYNELKRYSDADTAEAYLGAYSKYHGKPA